MHNHIMLVYKVYHNMIVWILAGSDIIFPQQRVN